MNGVALVTGAGGRIGAAIAQRLATAGHRIVVHYRASAEGAQATVGAIRGAGGEAVAVRADLSNRRQRAGLIDKAAKAFGPLTVLVNNASEFVPDALADLDEALWDAHFSVHLEAPVFLARDFAAQLPDDASGNIINMIDERVLHLSPAYFSYTLSKGALHLATTTMAQHLAPRIRVNAIGPGPSVPEKGKSVAEWKKAIDSLPLRRGATAAEIAEAVVFLIGAPAITGQMIALDGGRHIDWSAKRAPTPRKP